MSGGGAEAPRAASTMTRRDEARASAAARCSSAVLPKPESPSIWITPPPPAKEQTGGGSTFELEVGLVVFGEIGVRDGAVWNGVCGRWARTATHLRQLAFSSPPPGTRSRPAAPAAAVACTRRGALPPAAPRSRTRGLRTPWWWRFRAAQARPRGAAGTFKVSTLKVGAATPDAWPAGRAGAVGGVG